MTFWILLKVILVFTYILINIITAKRQSAKQMYRDFVKGQCLVGKICANVFYAPAWFLKVVRAVVIATIR